MLIVIELSLLTMLEQMIRMMIIYAHVPLHFFQGGAHGVGLYNPFFISSPIASGQPLNLSIENGLNGCGLPVMAQVERRHNRQFSLLASV
uniref:AlNc14C382G11233 protein n=1 Tax=Albugo laibachii Nc14 TaxID=890382 RepID=F0WYH2_9STRA|nr:AlNc14C382G11233 [Albugo laibachii Nc14]|eukprot:CCA26527.1 AlNc14C382G11233 [Albugo laibachii Nc14]